MRVALVFAHCDDELLFGWPCLLDRTLDRRVFICSDDSNNPARRWCRHRRDALAEVCDDLGVPWQTLPLDSGFAFYDRRNGRLRDACAAVVAGLAGYAGWADVVMTHNPHGEYGHFDHVLVHRLVRQHWPGEVWYTDVCVQTDWPAPGPLSGRERRLFYADRVCDKQVDTARFRRYEGVYRRHRVWTWSGPGPVDCALYRLGPCDALSAPPVPDAAASPGGGCVFGPAGQQGGPRLGVSVHARQPGLL